MNKFLSPTLTDAILQGNSYNLFISFRAEIYQRKARALIPYNQFIFRLSFLVKLIKNIIDSTNTYTVNYTKHIHVGSEINLRVNLKISTGWQTVHAYFRKYGTCSMQAKHDGGMVLTV